MRILVYGAGVQGCQLAHSLAQNKKNVVTLLARGEWKEVIDQKGLTIRHMLQRKTTVDRMQTTDVLAPEDVYDLVFVTVQAGQLADVLPILKANRSQYFIFVGNDPYAQEMLQAMQRPVDKIAFGFQNNAGRREHDRLVSVHMGMGMTVGGATAPLSGRSGHPAGGADRPAGSRRRTGRRRAGCAGQAIEHVTDHAGRGRAGRAPAAGGCRRAGQGPKHRPAGIRQGQHPAQNAGSTGCGTHGL